MGFGIIGAGAKLKEFLKKFAGGFVKVAKTIARGVKKALDIPAVRGIVNSLSKMVGIPVEVGEIVSKGVDLVNAGADVIDQNFITSKPQKNILKDANKFDFQGTYDQMSNLIKTRNPK
jgi:hypothetical protein